MTGPAFDARKQSFGALARSYDSFRPDYPGDALDWFVGGALRTVRDVADVGAGTGILTRQLLERDLHVVAVEPDEAMLAVLARRSPEVRRVRASAEATGLDEHSVDAVAVGQAFHWFDGGGAASEFSRILRPGGVVGVLNNVRDERVTWLGEIGRITGAAEWSEANADDVTALMARLFARVERREFTHEVRMTREQFIGLVSTYSYVNLREDADDVVAAVRAARGRV